jgi:hypothetical protein
MKALLFMVVISIGFYTQLANARIGWTLDQCVKLYGPYTSRVSQAYGMTVYDFTVGSFDLTVGLDRDGLVKAIDYHKADYSGFSDGEIFTLMDKNKGESTWDYKNPNRDGSAMLWRGWHFESLTLLANYWEDVVTVPPRWILRVCTAVAWYEFENARTKQANKHLDNL